MLRLLGLLARRRARGRAVLSVAGIALGVALGYGVHLVNRAAVEELAASVRADLGITPSQATQDLHRRLLR